MGVATQRPTGFSAASNVEIDGGSPSGAAATSDDTDATYIRPAPPSFPRMYARVNFDNPALPAGARMIRIRLRVRSLNGLFAPGPSFFYPHSFCGNDLPVYYIGWYSHTTTVVAEIPVSSLPSSPNWNFNSANNDFANGDYHIFEIYYDCVYAEKPVPALSSPSGTLTDTNLPSVSWTETLDPDGGDQSAYQVKIFSAAQYGAGGFDPATSTPVADSGVKAGPALSWQDTVRLPDDTYRAYVRVAQTLNGTLFWSDWVYGGFAIDVPNPGVPTLVVVPDDYNGRIRIDAGESAGEASTERVQVQRSVDDGSTWADLRTVQGAGAVDLTEDAADFEAPNGSEVSYRARAVHEAGTALSVSGWSATVSAVWESGREWLKHPTRPELNLQVHIHSLPARKSAARQGVFQPLGRADPVVVSDVRQLDTGDISFRADSAEDREALEALLADNGALLLQTPPNENWRDTYLSLGDRDSTRVVDKAFTPITIEAFAWTEVAAPVGDIDAWPEL